MKITIRTWRERTVNRWHDLLAVLAGYCNHSPYSPIPGEGGGYAHWRCALRRGHPGMHRGLNYVWSDDGQTSYLPVPLGVKTPSQPWDRSMTRTRRQQRRLDAWHEQQTAKRRAARRDLAR